MFYKAIKKNQSQNHSQTWQQLLKNREMVRNSYHASDDVKKAKAFVNAVAMYKPHTHFAEHGEHIIFSYEAPDLTPEPAYTFAT